MQLVTTNEDFIVFASVEAVFGSPDTAAGPSVRYTAAPLTEQR